MHNFIAVNNSDKLKSFEGTEGLLRNEYDLITIRSREKARNKQNNNTMGKITLKKKTYYSFKIKIIGKM